MEWRNFIVVEKKKNILWIIRLLREIDSADMKAKKKKKKRGISKLKFWNVNGKK